MVCEGLSRLSAINEASHNSGSQSPAGRRFESLWLWLKVEAEPLAGNSQRDTGNQVIKGNNQALGYGATTLRFGFLIFWSCWQNECGSEWSIISWVSAIHEVPFVILG